MKILIFGKHGQLGMAFQKNLKGNDTIFLGRDDCNLKDLNSVFEIINKVQPQIIINTAAYTAVDDAENDPDTAMAINANALLPIVRYCKLNNKTLLHFSTDYVFNGKKNFPYDENDICDPLNQYGYSKLSGERIILEYAYGTRKNFNAPKFCFYILRSSWFYGAGDNFILKILNLAKKKDQLEIVSDQFGVPTSTNWLAALSLCILKQQDMPSGIYHAVPAGRTNWYEISKFVIEYAINLGMKFKLDLNKIYPIAASEYPILANRPKNSCLSAQKLIAALPDCKQMLTEDWKVQLKIYLEEIHKKV